MIESAIGKNSKNKNIQLKQLQQLTGFLNFLGKAVVPGRAFTRRLYAIEEQAKDKNLKKYHHIKIRAEMRMDLQNVANILTIPKHICQKFY